MKNFLKNIFLTSFFVVAITTAVGATPLSIFSPANGWTQFADDDGYRNYDGYVIPGYGRQDFDAEHLFYKLQNNILSIGLQAGFDLSDGHFYDSYWGDDYYAGDLALSFDGNTSYFEYAVDFGLFTRDWVNGENVGGNGSGTDTEGLYRVGLWNNDVYDPFGSSRPFAMESGTLLQGQLTENSYGSGSTPVTYNWINGYKWYYGGYSYYRMVSFSLNNIPEISGSAINLDAHWTMSCGNDAVNGKVIIPRPEVPEPGTMFLLGSLATGLFGFAGLRRRFTK